MLLSRQLKKHHVIVFIKKLICNIWCTEDILVSSFSSLNCKWSLTFILSMLFISLSWMSLPNEVILKVFSTKAKAFKSSFYPWSFKEWGKRKTILLSFIRTMEISVVAVNGTNCLKLLTHLRLNPNHWNEHKYRHGFRDTIALMGKCGVQVEVKL